MSVTCWACSSDQLPSSRGYGTTLNTAVRCVQKTSNGPFGPSTTACSAERRFVVLLSTSSSVDRSGQRDRIPVPKEPP